MPSERVVGRGESDEALVAVIREEIERAGRITFARYMELALYHPEHGYYLGPEERAGHAGDFATAPETSPLFGRCLARQLREVWELLGRPSPFTVIEYGEGGGRLARDVLARAREESLEFTAILGYVLHEANAQRRARAARVTEHGGGRG